MLNIEVLQKNIWPNLEGCETTLPKPLANAVSSFELYYKNKNSNRRKLEWLFSQGDVEIAPQYTEKKYQVVVNVPQAAILYLFNTKESYTCAEIK